MEKPEHLRIAIIGAGISGLSCAHELEKYGIFADIYEKNNFVGEQITHVTALLHLIERPIRDQLEYIRENFGIEIRTLNTIKRIIHVSPMNRAVINGDLGYFIYRGREHDDLKLQIFSQLTKSNLIVNTVADHETLCKDYDHVIDASGTNFIPKQLGCWFPTLTAIERGAVVLGSFDPRTLFLYINKEYGLNGYAYLIPFNSRKAFITLIIPGINEKESEFFWELFLKTENLKFEIIEEIKLLHSAGTAYPPRTGNLTFVGNAAGALDPFLGFGQFNSIFMGVMAARSIVTGEDYESLISQIILKIKRLYEFRKAFDKLDDTGYDKLLSYIGSPALSKFIYNTNVQAVKYGGDILSKIN